MMALKDVADFDLLINYTRRWDEKNREFPPNAKWVDHIEKGKYDLVILNIDQQCTNYDLNKAMLMQHMKEICRKEIPEVPRIWINHATPIYPEKYPDGNKQNNFVSEQLKKEIMDIVEGDYMVCNSHQAQEEWGYNNSTTIIHGMEADEWMYNENKEPRICTFISAGGIGDKYYNRSFLTAVMDELKEQYGIALQWINTPGCFTAKGIKDYKEFLSKSLIYFNPTFASPMPRARTEAMLSGCCIVTTPQHGADMFIEDGVNGFLVPHNNIEYATKLIAKLLFDYEIAKNVGKKGRETAIKLFNRDRYRKDWISLLTKLNILK